VDHRAVIAWERIMPKRRGNASTVRRRLAALSSLSSILSLRLCRKESCLNRASRHHREQVLRFVLQVDAKSARLAERRPWRA